MFAHVNIRGTYNNYFTLTNIVRENEINALRLMEHPLFFKVIDNIVWGDQSTKTAIMTLVYTWSLSLK